MRESSISLLFDKDSPRLEEHRIIQAARHDPQAFGELYLLYVDQVFRYLYSRLGNVHEAEDVTGLTFLAAFESFDRFRQDGNFAPWLFTIARNKAMDHFRRNKKQESDISEETTSAEMDPLSSVIQSEQAVALSRLIQGLPEDEQELLRLRFLAEMTYGEIAHFLHRTEQAVKKTYTACWRGYKANWRFQMEKSKNTPQFEEDIRQAFGVPKIRSEFVAQLHGELIQKAIEKTPRVFPSFRLRPAWIIGVAVLSVMIVATLVIGPQRVFAAVRGLLGYIPEVGIVDQSAPIRVLEEPVSVTREGISITVTSATLTGDKTHIEYRIFGVPGSAYPNREDVMGCTQPEYLRLPDGTQLARMDNNFQPVPAGVDNAVFAVPCIFNTLPGTVPEYWELPLSFVPAPPDLAIMPVIELSPSPQASLLPDATALPESAGTSTAQVDSPVTVNKVIETEDGYILVGQVQPESKSGETPQLTGNPEIHDASGKIVSYTNPVDVSLEIAGANTGVTGWGVQFKAAGLVYPLTIRFPGVYLFQPDPSATAGFTFDAGPNPQPGQEWAFNQEIQLAGHTLKLVSIMADSRGGYSFFFQVDPQVFSASVQIEGFTPSGGGGGGGGGLTNGEFNVTLSYAQIPTGVLTITLSNLTLIGDPITWQGQWSPTTPRTDLPVDPALQSGVCLTADSLAQLQPAPPTLSNGKALIYEKLDTGTWGLVLYNLDGSQKQVVVPAGNWGALSPDGSRVAYSATDNRIHIVDVASQTEEILPGAGGFNLHWSPDGKRIAYVGMGNGVINSVFVINTDGTLARQVSTWSYEAVIGWSPDGTQLYFVAPFTGGAAWKVYAYDLGSGTAQERFTIENGTAKFLNPKLSPDGNWIAYRGQDNSSLYLVRTDGSDMHLVLDNTGAVGIEWSQSGWLGVSLRKADSDESRVALIKPDACEAYLLPTALQGDLEGLFIP